MVDTLQSFTPDWFSPPGETIADFLEERDWTQAQLSERLGFTTKHISQLINGKASITEDTALKLERVLGSTVAFWLNREAQYRAQLAKAEEQKLLMSWVPWLDKLPVKEMMHKGVIPACRLDAKNKPGLVRELLTFFGVASPDDWQKHYVGMQASFRQTRPDQCDVGAISAWLRQGEIVAEQLPSSRYRKDKFEKAIEEIRTLTVLAPNEFVPEMRQLCCSSGVVLVLVPSVPRARTSGMARWLNPHKALIQLSLYGKTNDKFWFNFFHEAAHILLHADQKKDIFLDDWGQGEKLKSQQETEADQWAGEFLIPPEYKAELSGLRSKEAVTKFAKKLGIHPAIVVGRLQYERVIPVTWMNKEFKESFDIDAVTTQPALSDDFDQAVNYVLNKNRELYERLA